MSQSSKKSTINTIIAALLGLLIAKYAWLFIDTKYLPKVGVDLEKDSGIKQLYYHYNLASKKDKPKPIVKKRKPVAKVVKRKPKEPEKITKFILTGIYNSKEKKIVVIEYMGKSYVIAKGEEIEGYKLVKLYPTKAIFKKDGKEYVVDLYKEDGKRKSTARASTRGGYTPPPREPKEEQTPRDVDNLEPIQEGTTTIIPKSLFNKYKGDYRAIRRNINAVPYMENGKLSGFKISFVRPGSDFSKLGLKRGDIILSINGEKLDNFKVPLEFFNNADTLTAATFTIKRGNEIKELEYEVR